MARDFLKDKKIIGTMLVSRGGEMLNITVPELLKWCDWVLLMMDNENDETRNICNDLFKRYPERIRIEHSGFPRATEEQENTPRGLFHRFKPLQGPIRDTVFEYFRQHQNEVDILIWPDSDEIFSDSFKQLLIDFNVMDDKKAITMKPVDVFGDMNTIHSRSMTGHTRVFKFFPELTALPYRTACNHRPLTKLDRIGSSRVLIHLCSLSLNKRDWRNTHWKPNANNSEALWRLPKNIKKMTPDELHDILHKEPDLTIEEYLRGGDKRLPVGVNNANTALLEASVLLTDIGVRHYLAFGTALGVYRDKMLIKWDWDVDLICLGEDIDKIDNNVKKILDAGFSDFKRKQDIPKWKREDGTISEEKYVRTYSFKKYGVRIDIDPAYISADGKSRLILKGRKRQIFVAEVNIEWFDNPLKIRYNNYEYNLPNPPEDYLKSNYGNGWNKPTYGPMPWSKRQCKRDYWEIK